MYDRQRTLAIRIAAITLASDSAITIARFRPSKMLSNGKEDCRCVESPLSLNNDHFDLKDCLRKMRSLFIGAERKKKASLRKSLAESLKPLDLKPLESLENGRILLCFSHSGGSLISLESLNTL